MGKVWLFIDMFLYYLKNFNKIHISIDISEYIFNI